MHQRRTRHSPGSFWKAHSLALHREPASFRLLLLAANKVQHTEPDLMHQTQRL
ncbi:hypothetical protein L345_10920, partial [Ophiophagus hannah]